MEPIDGRRRFLIFALRLWQPIGACMTCMPGSLMRISSLAHWEIAVQTGLGTGVLVILLSFTPARVLFGHRYRNAFLMGVLTALGDAYSHARNDGIRWPEVVLTGLTSGVLALAASWLFEDRAGRLRRIYRALTGAR